MIDQSLPAVYFCARIGNLSKAIKPVFSPSVAWHGQIWKSALNHCSITVMLSLNSRPRTFDIEAAAKSYTPHVVHLYM